MDDPFVADPLADGPLTHGERAALAAWAEQDALTGFADSVVAAWAMSQATEAKLEVEAFDGATPFAEPLTEPMTEQGADASVAGIRRLGHRPSGIGGVVGLVAAFAAAAAVMLMVRVLPRDVGSLAVARDCARSAAPRALESESGLAAMERGDGSNSDSVGAPYSVLEADAMAVLTAHCSPCHDGAAEGAQSGALDVFDVRQPKWRTMSGEQLRQTNLRFGELGTVTDDERRRMTTFVEAELSRRAHAG